MESMTRSRRRAEPAPPAAPQRPEDGTREILDLLATLAVSGLPRSSECSMALAAGPEGCLRTVAATSPLARDLDAALQHPPAGPALAAIRDGRDVQVALPSDRWPQLSRRAIELGLQSIWSLPLTHSGSCHGALTVYAASPEPWSDPRSGATRVVAALAALEVANAEAAADLAHGNATLREALETRTVIGQAQGILMARQKIGAEDAFDILRRASQRTNRKLRDIAAEMVAGVASPPAPARS